MLDLSVLSLLFFIWGFVTCLNDILIPHLKEVFDLNYFQAALVQFTFFFAYFALAIPSSKIINRLGYQKTMVVGLLIAACGAFCFLPSAKIVSYPAFLASLFALASGITLLQVSANPYVLAIGPESGAASRLNLTQAFNSLGTTVAPWLGGILILSNAKGVEAVIFPYIMLTVILIALAALFMFYRLPPISEVQAKDAVVPMRRIFLYRHTVLGALAIFLYVGAEVSIGSFLINYLTGTEGLDLTEKTAASYVSIYWGGAMVGRFIGSALLRRVGTGTLLGIFSVCAASLIFISISSSGTTAMATILAVGLFNSIMFPSIFALGVAELGSLTSLGSSLLVMAIVGGAIVPVLTGAVADHATLSMSFFIPLACYGYLCFYGFKGSKVLKRG